MTCSREMPRYKCIKDVWALKIANLVSDSPGVWHIVPEEDGYAPIEVEATWIDRHAPIIGGYYVVYKDGYTSFSPAKAFEDGYVRQGQ